VGDFNEFTERCKEAEHIFWYERFPIYREWKETINKEFRKNGFIEIKWDLDLLVI